MSLSIPEGYCCPWLLQKCCLASQWFYAPLLPRCSWLSQAHRDVILNSFSSLRVEMMGQWNSNLPFWQHKSFWHFASRIWNLHGTSLDGIITTCEYVRVQSIYIIQSSCNVCSLTPKLWQRTPPNVQRLWRTAWKVTSTGQRCLSCHCFGIFLPLLVFFFAVDSHIF